MGELDSAPPHFLQVLIFTFALLSPVVSEAQCPTNVVDVETGSSTFCEAQASITFKFPDDVMIQSLLVGAKEIPTTPNVGQLSYGMIDENAAFLGFELQSGGWFSDDDILSIAPTFFLNDNLTFPLTVTFNDPLPPGQCQQVTVFIYYTLTTGETCSEEIVVDICNQDTYSVNEHCVEIVDQNGCPMPDLGIQTNLFTDCINPNPILFSQTGVTDPVTGKYCFELPEGECVDLEIDNCESFCAGSQQVNPVDVTVMREYILGRIGKEGLGPWGPLLADINQSGSITTLDLVLLQRDLIDGLPDIPKPCLLFNPDLIDLDGNTDSEWTGTISSEVCDGDDIQLVAARWGDIDGTCTCDNHPLFDGGLPPSEEVLFTAGTSARGAQLVVVEDMSFYDLSLTVNVGKSPKGLTAEAIKIEGAHVEAVANAENGTTTLLIVGGNEPIYLPKGSSLLTINGAEAITKVSSSYVYHADYHVSKAQMTSSLDTRSAATAEALADLHLYYAQDQLMVEASKDISSLNITAFDLAGRQLWSQSSLTMAAGLSILEPNLNYSGLVIFHLTDGQEVRTLKAILP